jgi:hypothetical protein
MKRIIVSSLIILITILYSQDNWSSARQLSRTGEHPYEFMGVPAITVDYNGTIYAFWISSPSPDGSVTSRYSQIEYRRSSDGGKTWSATENLTPEYTEKRIYYMKAVCDSENNVHLVYMRGSEGYEVLYKRFDGSTWSEPQLIGYGTSNLQMNIDNDDRIYATWLIGYDSYFSYCDDGVWSAYTQIGNDKYILKDIKFDSFDLLYAVGYLQTELKPYLYIYDKMVENWIKFEEMPNDSLGYGWACAVSTKDTLFINNGIRVYENSKDLHLNMDINTGIYSTPYEYGDKNAPDREMYIDKYGYLHLFETHFYGEDTMGAMGLLHNIGKNGIWQTTVIDSSNENFNYTSPYIAFDRINNLFYLIYKISDEINDTSHVYFRSKQNTTSIENNDEILIDNYALEQNYPNPFNNQTQISYNIANQSHVELSVFNTKGEIVSVLVNSEKSKSRYSITFNADELNSGIYYYQLKIDGVLSSVKRMILLK